MLKSRVMAASSVVLSVAAIFFVYGVGAALVHGDWKTFGIAVGILALSVVAQLVIGIWHDSY